MGGTVAVVDYGLGNVRSVVGAIERLGRTAVLTNRVDELGEADRLILPGVGAFGDGMSHLRARGLVEPLTRLVCDERKPILGICLGAHLFARVGQEFGEHEGLGWIDADVVALTAAEQGLRVPHVGWNELHPLRASVLLANLRPGALFYYVHSYYLRFRTPEVVTGECEYGGRFAATFETGNVYGTQFHPEKSQRDGLTLLANFLERA